MKRLDFVHLEAFDVAVWQWLVLGAFALALWIASRILEPVVLGVASRAARLSRSRWDDQVVLASTGPARLLIFTTLFMLAAPALKLKSEPGQALRVLATSALIVGASWFALRFVRLASSALSSRFAESGAEVEASVRGVRTQIAVLARVTAAVIYVLTASVLLLQLESVRSIGVSLLASAGVAGLVVGLAAQKSISTLLAGIQLSLTQPVRLGDTVIVEGEWGWVEDITLTYAVIRVWDLRRLVVPITWFLDRPFQNWSRVSADILGTVELAVDPKTDVASLRGELERTLRQDGGALWDGKVASAQVTACTEVSMTVRLLVSSSNPSANWDLRCLVRERLLGWLQQQPHGLPVIRIEQPAAASERALAATARNGARAAGRRL